MLHKRCMLLEEHTVRALIAYAKINTERTDIWAAFSLRISLALVISLTRSACRSVHRSNYSIKMVAVPPWHFDLGKLIFAKIARSRKSTESALSIRVIAGDWLVITSRVNFGTPEELEKNQIKSFLDRLLVGWQAAEQICNSEKLWSALRQVDLCKFGNRLINTAGVRRLEPGATLKFENI